MATLLQRPPLAMFDPSLIHRNDEIFNPEPNGLGFFLRCIRGRFVACFKALMQGKSQDICINLTLNSERMLLEDLTLCVFTLLYVHSRTSPFFEWNPTKASANRENKG